jgi:hypothetical protein
MDHKQLGAALLARATRDLLLSEPTARAAWDWLFLEPDPLYQGWSAQDAAWAIGRSLHTLRRELVGKGYGVPPQKPFKVPAVLVPRKNSKHQPGWIKCQRCFHLAPVEDIHRASLCRQCGRRSPNWYAKKAANSRARN